jgi:hypothetical protein
MPARPIDTVSARAGIPRWGGFPRAHGHHSAGGGQLDRAEALLIEVDAIAVIDR